MIDWSVSWLQFGVIAVAGFIANYLYYSPFAPWFKAWAAGVGMAEGKREMTEAERKEFPVLMGGALLSALLLSYGLQVLVRNLMVSNFFEGAVVGVLVWLTFAVTHSLNSRFEGRKPIVLIINNGIYLVSYAVFAGILAVWL